MGVRDVQTRKCLQVLAADASATRNGATIDHANYEESKFVVTFGAIAAGASTSIKVQQGNESDASDMSDLAGTSITVAADDDGQVFATGLIKPQKRYVRVVVVKDASNATNESATVELYGARTLPAFASITDELTTEVHVSPEEGTA